jgi:hypothetical protein
MSGESGGGGVEGDIFDGWKIILMWSGGNVLFVLVGSVLVSW